MDGKGRCIDNVFVERPWRSLKYEEIYLRAYENGDEARAGVSQVLRVLQRAPAALVARLPDARGLPPATGESGRVTCVPGRVHRGIPSCESAPAPPRLPAVGGMLVVDAR